MVYDIHMFVAAIRHRPHDLRKRNLNPDAPSDIESRAGEYVIIVTKTYGSRCIVNAQMRRNENDGPAVH